MTNDNWQNPYEEGPSRQFRSAHYAQKTSALAVLSVASGILSFPMMCLCFLSIPFSIFAIVCGHMSRGVVRDSNGEYGGMEMATIGMLMGYVSLLIMGGMLIFGLASQNNFQPGAVPVPQPMTDESDSDVSVDTDDTENTGAILLLQAEDRLESEDAPAMGVETTDGDAEALARHYIETLNVLDSTHFSETNREADAPAREYRVFVQLNADSVAFLVSVPELNRFTPEAREILYERSWLIAQRSVDDILAEGSRLAVAIYSSGRTHHVMTGVTARSGPADAGLKKSGTKTEALAAFFQLDARPAEAGNAEEPVDSQIKPKEAPAEL